MTLENNSLDGGSIPPISTTSSFDDDLRVHWINYGADSVETAYDGDDTASTDCEGTTDARTRKFVIKSLKIIDNDSFYIEDLMAA